MNRFLRFFVFTLAFFCFSLAGTQAEAQEDCLVDDQTHVESEMPKDSFEWFFRVMDNGQIQSSLLFPTELKGAAFFQAIAQKNDDVHYEYAFPLEVLDHPLTGEAKQIEFIISNEQLSTLVINIEYLEEPYIECRGKKSYSYLVKAP